MKRLFAPVVTVVLCGTAALLSASEVQRRTLHIIATDKNGVPITNLSASDFVVKEDNRTVAPINVAPATAPIQLALIIDDRGLDGPELREAASGFARALVAHAAIGLFSVARPEVTVVDFTHDMTALDAGITSLTPFAQSGTTSMRVAPVLTQMARHFQTVGAKRPAIVIVTREIDCGRTTADRGTEEEDLEPYRVWFRRSVSSDPCVSYGYAASGSPGPPGIPVRALQTTGASVFVVDMRPSDSVPILGRSFLTPVTSATGGHVVAAFTSAAVLPAMMRIARELSSQYEVTYTAPVVSENGAKLRIDVRRPGTTVYAPDRVGVR